MNESSEDDDWPDAATDPLAEGDPFSAGSAHDREGQPDPGPSAWSRGDIVDLAAEARSRRGTRFVRTHDERMESVRRIVDASTPSRPVRTPEERRAAVQAVLEERERSRQRQIRDEQERRAAVARAIQEQAPSRQIRTPEERRADLDRVLEAAMRRRDVRSNAERVADARRAAEEELERRKRATEELRQRLTARRLGGTRGEE